MPGGKMRSDGSDAVTTLFCFLVIGVTSALPASASSPDRGPMGGRAQALSGGTSTTPAVGDAEHPPALKWTRLTCPSGEYAVGFTIRQGGWLSRIGVQCAAPTPTGGWAAQPVSGGAAGGEYGSHAADLICPRGRWVTGLAGLQVRVGHIEGLVDRLFLADPVVSCGAPDVPGLKVVRDPHFEPEQASRFDLASARYSESPAQYCAPGLFSIAAEAAVQPQHHPDVRAVRLVCALLRGRQGTHGASAPSDAGRPPPSPPHR